MSAIRLIHCRYCKQIQSNDCFTPYGIKKKRCKTCAHSLYVKYTTCDDAHRLLFCLRAYCRKHRLPEGSIWTLQDVEQLLEKYEYPIFDGKKASHVRIVRCDVSKPFLPSNARVTAYGCL